jgi:hypothetical protein
VAAALGMRMATAAPPPVAHEVDADAPTDLSVTVYRAPGRSAGSMDLDFLQGFALIREIRIVRLAAGLSRIRFAGVADGIEPVSAIVTGLPDGVIEKNLDAELLSPKTLLAAAGERPLTLLRSNPKTGKTERLPGIILSGADADGVVFRTEGGIEALRCSGLPEGFEYGGETRLAASPTLSVLVRAPRPITRSIQLSYLAHGFDWAADYTATLAADGKTMDLGAWVTLANGNGVGFPAARTQVVAGRVNREAADEVPVDEGGPILARCWPRGSTSDAVQFLEVSRAIPLGFESTIQPRNMMYAAAAMGVLNEVAVTGSRVRQEQLGDLKLYRVPQRTTVASRQSKQVRLLDRAGIPVQRVISAQVAEDENVGNVGRGLSDWAPASVLLRTRNDTAHHLGLPLPSGQVAVFQSRQGSRLLLGEADIADRAVHEDVEIVVGPSPDVQVQSESDQVTIDPQIAALIPLVPGVVSLREPKVVTGYHVEVSNAADSLVAFELRLRLHAGTRVTRADHPLGTLHGSPVFRLQIPAHATVRILFAIEHGVIAQAFPSAHARVYLASDRCCKALGNQ